MEGEARAEGGVATLEPPLPADLGDAQRRIIHVDPRALLLLEKNAHFMPHEKYMRLVNNIRKDRSLDSVPLACWSSPQSEGMPDDAPGKWRVLSGNHRVRASIDAEMSKVFVMVIDAVLDLDEFIAKQLSHNALVGDDDQAILRELYEQIESVDWKQYAALDDKLLGLLEEARLEGMAEAALSYTAISFVMLPDEVARAREAWEIAKTQVFGDELWLARMAEYDAFLDSLEMAGSAHNVKNVASQLMLVVETFLRHPEELRAGFLDDQGEAKHKGWVPLAAVLNTSKVPATAAAKIHRAVRKMVAAGEVEAGDLWKALEVWAELYERA